jgi:hypothetical protein
MDCLLVIKELFKVYKRQGEVVKRYLSVFIKRELVWKKRNCLFRHVNGFYISPEGESRGKGAVAGCRVLLRSYRLPPVLSGRFIELLVNR